MLALEAMAAERRGGDDRDDDRDDDDDAGGDTLLLQVLQMLTMYVVDLMTCAWSKKESLCYSWYGAGQQLIPYEAQPGSIYRMNLLALICQVTAMSSRKQLLRPQSTH